VGTIRKTAEAREMRTGEWRRKGVVPLHKLSMILVVDGRGFDEWTTLSISTFR
jgi:hypothetical protein